MAEHKNKFDRDMLLNRQNMSESEYKRLLAEHQHEMKKLTDNMDSERERQKRVISDRVCSQGIKISNKQNSDLSTKPYHTELIYILF